MIRKIHRVALLAVCLFSFQPDELLAQNMKIRGFFDFNTGYVDDKAYFALGEQDLFITSKLSDRIDFLGETVFKYASESSTSFTLGLERAIIKYNFSGNHNLIFGKHHTPINYWNDTYHHGRLFFPTIFRPTLFSAQIIPLHTVGIGIQGQNLGNLKFGYDVLAGNGIGSSEVADNDLFKSVTAAVHIKPADGLRVGASVYYDNIAAGAHTHTESHTTEPIDQLLSSASVGYFGKKFELLAEGTYGIDRTDSIGSAPSISYYGYAGYHLAEKIVLYARFDQILFDEKEMYYSGNDLVTVLGGLRFHVDPLAVIKVEYQHNEFEFGEPLDQITAQFAIGF